MNLDQQYHQAVTKLNKELNSLLTYVHNFQQSKKSEEITQEDVFLLNDISHTIEALKKRIEP